MSEPIQSAGPASPPTATAPSPLDVAMAEQLAALKAELTGLRQEIAKPASPVVPDATPAPDPAPDPFIATMKQRYAEEFDFARISHLKQMGYSGSLTNEDLLKIVPNVDPRTRAGIDAFEEWRTKNPKQFTSPGQTQQSVITSTSAQLASVPKNALFSAEGLINSVFRSK